MITTGGRLAARRVIHTVGPVWRGGDSGEAATLAACHRRSLELAAASALASIAFPAISTGAYGYPLAAAARVALAAAAAFLRERADAPALGRVGLFDGETRRVFAAAAAELLGPEA